MRRAVALMAMGCLISCASIERANLKPLDILELPADQQLEAMRIYVATLDRPVGRAASLSLLDPVSIFDDGLWALIRWVRAVGHEDADTYVGFAGRPQQFEWWTWVPSMPIDVDDDGVYSDEVRVTWNGCVEIAATLTEPGVDLDGDGEFEIPPLMSPQSNALLFGTCLPNVERIPISPVSEPGQWLLFASGIGFVHLLHRRNATHV